MSTAINQPSMILFEHADGRAVVAAEGDTAFTDGDPQWVRGYPVEVRWPAPLVSEGAESSSAPGSTIARGRGCAVRARVNDSEAREFLTSGERLCRTSRAPEIASLQFNPRAPDVSLVSLGIARAIGARAIVEMALEQELTKHVTEALQAACDAADEARLVLEELQLRIVERNRGVPQ